MSLSRRKPFASKFIEADKLKMFGNIDANANKIENVATPTNNNDAVTKSYVDGIMGEQLYPEVFTGDDNTQVTFTLNDSEDSVTTTVLFYRAGRNIIHVFFPDGFSIEAGAADQLLSSPAKSIPAGFSNSSYQFYAYAPFAKCANQLPIFINIQRSTNPAGDGIIRFFAQPSMGDTQSSPSQFGADSIAFKPLTYTVAFPPS